MQLTSPTQVSPAVAKVLADACPAGLDYLTLDRFIACALYDPDIGYYRSTRRRIGRDRATDFYTASSIRDTYANLVIESVRVLLGDELKGLAFVEIGPETEHGILGATDQHPFDSTHLLQPGMAVRIPARSIVFSNELFDAQPFRRFIRDAGKWKELGVRVCRDAISWIHIDSPKDPPALPSDSSQGYIVDWPQGSINMLRQLVTRKWSGLFVAFDYGLDAQTILHERPQGTGRTYSRHRMGTDLLDRPGEIDITHHVAWDIMEETLVAGGFENVRLFRQEAFFMKFAHREIQRIMEASPDGFDGEKQSLMELLHPGNMGHKFQVLSAFRPEN
jgi:SAM-dependent MidA family methyltransferase